MEIASLELAKKLKEKGFNYPCLFVYNKEQIINPEVIKAFGELSDDGYYELTKEGGGKLDWNFVYIDEYQLIPYGDVLIAREIIRAPIISKVLKWLREEKKMHIIVEISDSGWYYTIYPNIRWENGKLKSDKYIMSFKHKDSYEQSALAGIEYVLDNLI